MDESDSIVLNDNLALILVIYTVEEITSWRSIAIGFLPVGICLLCVMQWRRLRQGAIAHHIEITTYKTLPLKFVSRLWGNIAEIQIPENWRPIVYGWYINYFGVNLEEAEHEDLRVYPSISDFFVRSLKSHCRPVADHCDLVSPCDGTVLHLTHVNTGKVEQVKGVTYELESFLGENIWNKPQDNCEYHRSLLHHSHLNTTLWQCIIYLAPGDYHRFHSPAEWHPCHRRHFPGELLSVNPTIAKWIPGLFCLNERAVYVGKWKHGFFSYTAVGATNVGSVKVYFDDALKTNHPKIKQSSDLLLDSHLKLKKGDMIGEFRMGSTIVLIFEAPSNFEFTINPGDRVRMGQEIGRVAETKFVDIMEKSANAKHELTR